MPKLRTGALRARVCWRLRVARLSPREAVAIMVATMVATMVAADAPRRTAHCHTPDQPQLHGEDDPIRAGCNETAAAFMPWRSIAQDKAAWDAPLRILHRSLHERPEATQEYREVDG